MVGNSTFLTFFSTACGLSAVLLVERSRRKSIPELLLELKCRSHRAAVWVARLYEQMEIGLTIFSRSLISGHASRSIMATLFVVST